MNKLYFLVLLLVSLGCANAWVEPLAVWFQGVDSTLKAGSPNLVENWRSSRPADNPMKPYLTAKNRATVEYKGPTGAQYKTVLLKNSCLKMTGYYSVQTTTGWSVAIHTTRATLANGYLFGGSHQGNTPAIVATANVTHTEYEWLSCNGFAGTTGNLCERYPITKDVVVMGPNTMITIIVTYVPKGSGGNTTIYVDGEYVDDYVTKTNNRNWDLNALGCSGWGDRDQSKSNIADFRIYEKVLSEAEAMDVHYDMKNRTSVYVPPTTAAPVPTTPAPIPTVPVVAPNVTKANCSGHGFYLTADATRCICDSGYEGPECEDATALDGNCTVNIAQTMNQDWYPHINMAGNHSSFAAGSLQAEIFSEIVKNRTFGSITFREANDSRCFLGTRNSFWQQTVDNCNDVFTLGLPWGQYSSLCGFKKQTTSTAASHIYKATVEMTYFDTLLDQQVMGEYLMRRTKVKFDLYLSFPTSLNIAIEDLQVDSVVEPRLAITMFEYDYVRSVMMMEVTTLLDWPNQLSSENLELNINNDKIETASAFTVDSTGCLNPDPSTVVDGKNFCKQKYYIELRLIGDECSFDATYKLNLTVVTCREAAGIALCTYENSELVDNIDLSFNIVGSNVCGSVSATPKVTAELVPFIESNRTTVMSQGFIGDSGQFWVRLVSDGASDLKMRFVDISIDDGVNNATYLWKDGAIKPPGIRSLLKVYHNDRAFNLTFDGSTFPVLPEQTILFTFTVRIELTYYGNDGFTTMKREIKEIEASITPTAVTSSLAYAEVGLKSRARAVEVVEQEDATETSATTTTTDNRMMLFSIVAPLAGVAVLTVLAATVYYITKSSKKQTTFYAKL